jgi:uncharacterized membrane protein YhaH (DUF805 family)
MTSKVGFGTAYKLFWKNYVNFTGRSRRSEYWYTVLWHIIVCIPGILLLVGGIIGTIMGLSCLNFLFGVLSINGIPNCHYLS